MPGRALPPRWRARAESVSAPHGTVCLADSPCVPRYEASQTVPLPSVLRHRALFPVGLAPTFAPGSASRNLRSVSRICRASADQERRPLVSRFRLRCRTAASRQGHPTVSRNCPHGAVFASVRCGTFRNPPSEPPCDEQPAFLRRFVSIVLQKPRGFANDAAAERE
jgi:hypothetical protein